MNDNISEVNSFYTEHKCPKRKISGNQKTRGIYILEYYRVIVIIYILR